MDVSQLETYFHKMEHYIYGYIEMISAEVGVAFARSEVDVGCNIIVIGNFVQAPAGNPH